MHTQKVLHKHQVLLSMVVAADASEGDFAAAEEQPRGKWAPHGGKKQQIHHYSRAAVPLPPWLLLSFASAIPHQLSLHFIIVIWISSAHVITFMALLFINICKAVSKPYEPI